jgi:hypothetical protein
MRIPAALVALLVLLGCGKTATIYKKNGTSFAGRIEKSDEKSVFVRKTRKIHGFSVSGTEFEEKVKLSPDGSIQEVEFVSFNDVGCMRLTVSREVLARKKYSYDENGKVRMVEIDMGGDGTVEKRKTYEWSDDGRLLKWEGDRDADGPELMERVKESQAYVRVVDRSKIADIDHPGNVAAIIGTTLTVASFVTITIGAYRMDTIDPCSGCDCGPVDVIGLLMTLVGVAVAIPSIMTTTWGWTTWSRSVSAAAPPEEPAVPKIAPVALSDGVRTYWGIGISWSW